MFKTVSKCLILILMISFYPAHAQSQKDLPSYYPDWYSSTGILHGVNIKSGTMVINASHYEYDANIKVHSLNTQYSSVRALKSGMEVGYNFHERGKKKLISQIWVLPKGTVVLR